MASGPLEVEANKSLSSQEIENACEESAPSFSPEEEAVPVRKIDLMLLPTMGVMYFLSYMDRTNIGNAKVSGMGEDLNLSSYQYSISLVVFFIGYVILEVPSNLILSRTQPSVFLPGIMMLWGMLTCVMAAIKDFKHLVVLRTLIISGCIEPGFAPGVLLAISSWYKKTEQSKRFDIYVSAAVLSGAFGGLITAGIVGGLEGGAATVRVALIALFILPDFPAITKRLSERERYVALMRLQLDNVTAMAEGDEQLSPWQAILGSVKD
ncbi:major facilitator superfamily domain-containing protein [Aspergillus leporis]|uniref:Major facilitator superfamily domain-containing protein n=1 Tax=Aspergillus leporis TaxID=41062 RepID=A0A5N5XEK0_9EURO|nr:major facilitator superfamily domain-containing protein [Aspergillus leporis]